MQGSLVYNPLPPNYVSLQNNALNIQGIWKYFKQREGFLYIQLTCPNQTQHLEILSKAHQANSEKDAIA